MVLADLIAAIWIVLPAYVAGGSATVSAKLKKTHPIDFGKKVNKNRILGDGKTWEGTLIGMIAGMLVGLIESYFNPSLTLGIIFLIPFGALVGDMVGSFIKRRFKMKRGKSLPLLDQLDFIIGMIVFTYAFVEYNLTMIIIILAGTYFLHRGTSIIGYKMNIKREPW